MSTGMLKNALQFFAFKEKIRVDNTVFKLHYKLTCGFLLTSFFLVSASALFGGSISCFSQDLTPGAPNPLKAIETYCYVTGTYSIKQNIGTNMTPKIPHPGLGTHLEETTTTVYHYYYIWVPLVLFLQSFTFYITHYIWKEMDRSHLENVMCNLQTIGLPDEKIHQNINQLIAYLKGHPKGNTSWYIRFSVCEAVNVLVVILNMVFTNAFLGGEFSKYGAKVFELINEDPTYRTDPMAMVFPRTTKCDWYMFGSSGTLQKYDAMCILPQNIMSEKLYVFIWFWFVFVLIMSCLQLVYRCLTFCVPQLRVMVLVPFGFSNQRDACRTIVDHLATGDWFLLTNIIDFMDITMSSKLVKQLAMSFDGEDVSPESYSNMETLPMSELKRD